MFDDGGLIDIVKGAKNDAEDLVQSEDKKMNDLLQEYANIMGGEVEIPEPPKDKTPPIVTVTEGGKTTNSITVSVQSTDNESGMIENPTYTYYIKKLSEADTLYQAKATDVTNASYTFTGLMQETSYDIKVEVNGDKAGNVGIGTLTGQVTTKVPGGETGVEEGAITFGTTTWLGGKASITVSTNTRMQIQYQVDSTSGAWTNISNGGTVSNLQHSQTVYARLTDGTNNGDYASVSIVDTVAPVVSGITTGAITANSIQVTVSASDGQSGLATSNTYKYYLNGNLKKTLTKNSYTFTGLSEGTSYTIKVEAYDKANNKGKKSVTTSTKTIPTVQEKLKEGDYVYYRDATGTTRKCVVLYDSSSNYGIQITTIGTVDSVVLGHNDPTVSGSDNFTKSLNSYNNAIKTLNSKAMEYNNSTYSSGARCIGSSPNNPNKDDIGYFTSSYGYMSSYNGKFKNSDTNYEADYNKIMSLNINDTDRTSFWLASRFVDSDTEMTYFNIRWVNRNMGTNILNEFDLYRVGARGGDGPGSSTTGFKPVFTLKSGIKVIEGDGTLESPYKLGV